MARRNRSRPATRKVRPVRGDPLEHNVVVWDEDPDTSERTRNDRNSARLTAVYRRAAAECLAADPSADWPAAARAGERAIVAAAQTDEFWSDSDISPGAPVRIFRRAPDSELI